MYDFKEDMNKKYKPKLYKILKGNVDFILNIYKKLKGLIVNGQKQKPELQVDYLKYYRKLKHLQSTFNEESLKALKKESRMLITLILYFIKLEEMYPEKFEKKTGNVAEMKLQE